MPDAKLEISVIVPVYNSSQTLETLYKRLQDTLGAIVGSRYEIIFVNDCSKDNSWQIINEMALTNENTIAINLTRNFGQHNALMCGFAKASGDYIVTIDDDLQIPPEEISALYTEVKKGYDIVYGLYRKKKHSIFRNLGSELVQFMYMRTFKTNIRLTSFRIVRREIIEHILSYKKSFTFIDGLISWFTSNASMVYVEHHEREFGKSGYSLKSLIILSLNMLTNFSITPVQIASLIGILFSMTGFLLGLFFFIKKIVFDVPVSGFTALIVTITIFAGVQLLTLGILGEYISRIHINVNNRPQFAIRETVSMQGQKSDTGQHESDNP